MGNRRDACFAWAAALALVSCEGLGGRTFTVTFPEAGGLTKGSPLVEKGVTIGRILGVHLQGDRVAMQVWVNSRYGDRICKESLFRIERAAEPSDGRVKGVLDVSRAPGNCTPVAENEILRGQQSLIQNLKDALKSPG